MSTMPGKIDPFARNDWDSEPIDLRIANTFIRPLHPVGSNMVEPFHLIGFQFRDFVLLSIFLASAASLSIPNRIGWEIELAMLVGTILLGADLLGEKRLSKLEAAIARHTRDRRNDQVVLLKSALIISNKTAGQIRAYLIVGHLSLLTVGILFTLATKSIQPTGDFESLSKALLTPLAFAINYREPLLRFSVSWILFFFLLRCPGLEAEQDTGNLRRAAKINVYLTMIYIFACFGLPVGSVYIASGAPPFDKNLAALIGFNLWLYFQAGVALSLHLRFLEKRGNGPWAVPMWIMELLMLSQYNLLFRLPFSLLPAVALLAFYTVSVLYFRLCLVVLRVSALRIAGFLILIAVGLLKIVTAFGS